MHWDANESSSSEKIIARIESIEAKQDDKLGLGRLSSGKLRISGHMVRSSERHYEKTPLIIDSFPSSYEVYDAGSTADALRSSSGSFHFILHHYDTTFGTSRKMDEVRVLLGLIVECIDQRSQTYRRIGMFRHCSGCSDEPCEYHEFDDWDPSRSERHTITIV